MNPAIKIETYSVFPIQIYQFPIPEFRKYHDAVTKLFEQKINAGEIEPHQHGYGYQTPGDLFFPGVYQDYFVEVLGKTFCNMCEKILNQSPSQHVRRPLFQWMNTLTIGWATIQTDRQWGMDPPWHTHTPATLSGCYYVSTASDSDEGKLQFKNPNANNVFQPEMIELVPKPGHMIIFPSFLDHRPSSCPNTKRMRIALCMDSHWTLQFKQQPQYS